MTPRGASPRDRWSELPERQRRGIVLAATVQFALWLIAVLDLRRRPAERIRGPKGLWLALSFVNYAGPLAYLTVGRRRAQ